MTTNSAGVYLRPGGFLGGVAGQQAVLQGKASQLAGGWVAFSLVEIIERYGKNVDRSWHSFAEMRATTEPAILELLLQLETARQPFCGLSMASPKIMGIVNVTPDSFSDGGEFLQCDVAIAHGRSLKEAGADILDIGGESTRPGAEFVSDDQEIARVVPVLEGLESPNAVLSIDTRKPQVMTRGVAAGAGCINDVTALEFSQDSVKTVHELGKSVCLMHSQGSPETMQDNPQYDDVVLDVYDYLQERIDVCIKAGIARSDIVVDPGIGFGKTVRHNLALIDEIAMFHGLGVPILLGASRKSLIGAIMDDRDSSHRLPGSLAIALAGVKSGVQVLRVHDVAETAQALKIWNSSENPPQF